MSDEERIAELLSQLQPDQLAAALVYARELLQEQEAHP